MEEQKGLILKDERAFYLVKHFEEIDKKGMIHFQNLGYSITEINQSLKTVGSKFYSGFCNNPFDLIQKISHYLPMEVIEQSNGSRALLYKIPFTGGIGSNTIINLKDITLTDKGRIQKVIRNGFYVNVLERNFYDFTNQLVVICNSFNEVITVFPVVYAPAFPAQLIDKDEINKSILFWENHTFIKNSYI